MERLKFKSNINKDQTNLKLLTAKFSGGFHKGWIKKDCLFRKSEAGQEAVEFYTICGATQ
jgi:hypothetical protein